MFDPAGILNSGLRIYTKAFQPGGKKCMAFINTFCDCFPTVSQINIPFRSHCNMIAFAQFFHGVTPDEVVSV